MCKRTKNYIYERFMDLSIFKRIIYWQQCRGKRKGYAPLSKLMLNAWTHLCLKKFSLKLFRVELCRCHLHWCWYLYFVMIMVNSWISMQNVLVSGNVGVISLSPVSCRSNFKKNNFLIIQNSSWGSHCEIAHRWMLRNLGNELSTWHR